jgi:acetyltransferase-like isoleucine patch superfamily enzyme
MKVLRVLRVFRVFRIRTGHRIAPFGDPVGETFVAPDTLAGAQARALAGAARLGLAPDVEEVRPGDAVSGPALLYRDDTFFTTATLVAFLAAPGPTTGQLAARDGLFLAANRALQDLPAVSLDGTRHDLFPLYRVAAGERLVVPPAEPADGPASLPPDGPPPVPVDLDEKRFRVPVPRQYFGDEGLEVGLTARAVLCVRHWVHVLRVNQVAAGAAFRATRPLRGALAVLWAALRAFSCNRWKVLGKLNRVGKGCDVHPTAVVEGSTLGPGCLVGPGARVRFSTLGAGVQVLPGAGVEFSTLGAGAMVASNCNVNFCVLYPGAAACQYLLQLSVLGRDVVTTGAAFSMDMHFTRDVHVEKDGRLEPAGTRFLGCCLGHGVTLGTGFWLAPGRAVPNGYVVVRDPSAVLARIPPGLPPGVPLAVRGGTLVAPAPDR